MSGPRTVEEARKHRYGRCGGFPQGKPYEEGYCIESVMPNERGAISHQCQRRIKKGTAGDAFCGQHDPRAVKAREVKSAEDFKRYMKHVTRPQRVRACYERALRKIVRLSGEPLSGDIAREALAKAKKL